MRVTTHTVKNTLGNRSILSGRRDMQLSPSYFGGRNSPSIGGWRE